MDTVLDFIEPLLQELVTAVCILNTSAGSGNILGFL